MLPDQRDAELTGRSAEREPGNGVEGAVDDPRPDEEPWRPASESGGSDGESGSGIGSEAEAGAEAGAEAEPEVESELESGAEASARSRSRSRAAKARPRFDGRRRAVLVGAVAAVVVLALAWAGSLSSVQTILRQSFTRQPTAYTEMYLSGTPAVSGITLSVPVTVVNHATTQDSFTLKVWTVNGAGKTETTTSIKVTPKHGEATVVVKVAVQISSDAQVLWINLVGEPQTLHYRIAGEAIPSPTATASATPTTTAKH